MKKLVFLIFVAGVFMVGCGKSKEEINTEVSKGKVEQQCQRVRYLQDKYKATDIELSFDEFHYILDYQNKLPGQNVLIRPRCVEALDKDSIKYIIYEPFSRVDYLQLWLKNVPMDKDFNKYVFVAKVDSVSARIYPRIYASCIYFEKYYSPPKDIEAEENSEDE